MYFDNPFSIPQELLSQTDQEEDISILVGENGSGKSSMLNEIGRHFLARGATQVIAIANTIHDKFNLRGARFEALKAATGKYIVKRTLKSALLQLSRSGQKRFNEIGRAMDYVQFEPYLGLKLTGVNSDYEKIIRNAPYKDSLKSEMASLLGRFLRETQYENGIFRINLYQETFMDFHGANLLDLLQFEKELKALKAIREIEVYLSRQKRFIPVNQGSSGELTLITSLIYLMTTISRGAIILIDEPENSLHPKWQSEYVKLIADLLYRYQPKIIIATHSPLIVNSAELTITGLKIFKGSGGSFSRSKTDVRNVEAVYQDFFDVTTPENRFLSQDVAIKMNQLAAGDISLNEFEQTINDFSRNSYDDKQKDVLSGVIEMGRKIIANL